MHKTILVLVFAAFFSSSQAQNVVNNAMHLVQTGNDSLFHFRPVAAAKYYQQVLAIAKQTKNPTLFREGYLGVGQAAWYQGYFQDAADTVLLALQYAIDKDIDREVDILRILSNIYDDMGQYEKAFEAIQTALSYIPKTGDNGERILTLVQVGKLYKDIGDFDAAMDYYQQAGNQHPEKGDYPYRELNHSLGNLYFARKIYDSALFFYKNALTGNPQSRIIRMRFGDYYMTTGKMDSAYYFYQPLYDEARRLNDINIQLATMIGLADIFSQSNQVDSAIRLTEEAFQLAIQRGVIEYRFGALKLLVRLYQQRDPAKALYYQQYFDRLKDSSVSDVFKGQLYAFRQKRQQAAIQSLQVQKKLAWSITVIIVLAAVFILTLLLLRHNNEKLRLKQQAAELQMQALRAQMNPHFIFNCLSAINHFVLNNETIQASDYLTRFSRLIRMVLMNANKSTISLEEELHILSLYLDMEQLRFRDAFTYNITIDPSVRPSSVSVPSFILQPFCENAIWHGLLHKEGKGLLDIRVEKEEHNLVFLIRDNGVGIEEGAKLKSFATDKKESLGQQLGANRIDIFNGNMKNTTSFTIRELKDEFGASAGTLVILKIKAKEL